MSQIIASTYVLEREIGSGGGGVVYLGKHLRLQKEVVLKADKRRLSAKPEVLRREVDALKNLRHAYIPQVYDFIEENGVVYTVMDYIPGESLDKPLKRGRRFSQPQVIQWACQLLEALVYLHSQPPHGILHSDIKPANIMITPEGNICLIDFNIALALGEEGAVRVGFSRGYASPEHYGVDYQAAAETHRPEAEAATVVERETAGTIVDQSGSSSGGNSKKPILLDVRSDIYSLGATLYHILSGVKPQQQAEAVVPLDAEQFSPAVIAIIQKAMAPNPAERYQTAEEMLQAFRRLYETDPRVRRRRRSMGIMATVVVLLLTISSASVFVGLRRMEQRQSLNALAEYAGNALAEGRVEDAIQLAVQALPAPGVYTPEYLPQAQNVLTKALGVYDLSDGFKLQEPLTMPSEPLKVVLSPEGQRAAILYAYTFVIYDLSSGEQLLNIEAEPSAMSDILFVSENQCICAGLGAVQAWDITAGEMLWSGERATQLALSGDGRRVAAVNRDSTHAMIYDTVDGTLLQTVEFGEQQQRVLANDILADPNDDLLALDETGEQLAASFSNGAVWVYDLRNHENDLILLEESQYTHFEGGFYGPYFAFSVSGPEDTLFAVIDTEQAMQTGAFAGTMPFLVRIYEDGIYLAQEDILVKIDPVTGEQTEVAYTEGETIRDFTRGGGFTLVATEVQNWWLFDQAANVLARESSENTVDFLQISEAHLLLGSLNTPQLCHMVMQRHDDAQVAVYDPTYAHDEARLSADGKTLMLFQFEGFQICSLDGTVLAQVELPDADEIYDQQFRREQGNSYLEVLYNDGTVRKYAADDGALLSEEQGETPDRSLYEEFYTDAWKITAPLHEAPTVYDRETGEVIRVLESDAYLTYVTQVEDYVLTEYLSTDGMRYGLLLNKHGDTVAELPYVCDVWNGQLLFDYPSGQIRKSPLYSIEELLDIAKDKGGT